MHPVRSVPDRSVPADRIRPKSVPDPYPIMIRSNSDSVLSSSKIGLCGPVDRIVIRMDLVDRAVIRINFL
jgi:hypothetical protein